MTRRIHHEDREEHEGHEWATTREARKIVSLRVLRGLSGKVVSQINGLDHGSNTGLSDHSPHAGVV